MSLKQFRLPLLLLCVALGCTHVASSSSSNAEEARWLVSEARWGVLTTVQQHSSDDVRPLAGVVPMADDGGHIYLYLMQQEHDEHDSLATQASRSVAITFSEASLYPYSNFAKGACGDKGQVDSEDPRCAKLTLTGTLAPCDSEDVAKGEKALFERHPQMKDWPADHQFVVYEIIIDQEGWMISNYGGGGTFSADAYYKAAPQHHPAYGIESTRSITPGVDSALLEESPFSPVPDWKQKVERARWIVANSLVTTVSAKSGLPFGNIRSVVDGSSLATSSGMPVFYLPTPDPTAIDVLANPHISLSFTEAMLSDRISKDGQVCGGKDEGDPTCGMLVLSGTAVVLEAAAALQAAKQAFAQRHPLAPWLAHGGAHTGGKYVTIQIGGILLLDWYGGPTQVDVDEFLDWSSWRSWSTGTPIANGVLEEEERNQGGASKTLRGSVESK